MLIRERLAFLLQRHQIQKLFRKNLGVEGDFEHPKTFQEKIQFRKLYGNHAFYGRLADKFLVREYVKEKVGEEILIPLLCVTDHLTPEIFETLPKSFAIKLNNASKWNQLVFDKNDLDIGKTIRYFNRKIKKKYSRKSGEVHYDYIKPQIVIEALILDDGELPWNYCFFSYHNSRGFDFQLTLTSPDQKFQGHLDKNGVYTDGNLTPEMIERYARPKGWERMVDIARRLSEGIDFVRVDLYNVKGRIYFGELTFTPASGLAPLKDPLLAASRAEKWELDADNPNLYRRKKS